MKTYTRCKTYIANIMLENGECNHKQSSFCNKVITPLDTIATIENTRYLTNYYICCYYCTLYTNIYVLSLQEPSYNRQNKPHTSKGLFSLFHQIYILYIVKEQQVVVYLSPQASYTLPHCGNVYRNQFLVFILNKISSSL